MNATPEDPTPELRTLALRLAGLPVPGPDGAAQSRMRRQLEWTIAQPRSPWWTRRLYLGAIVVALALGLGAAGAASRSPLDLVKDPRGVIQDAYSNITGDGSGPGIACDEDGGEACPQPTPTIAATPSNTPPADTPEPVPSSTPQPPTPVPSTGDDGPDDDNDKSGPGRGDDDADDDNSGRGGGAEDNRGRGSGDDDDDDEDDD